MTKRIFLAAVIFCTLTAVIFAQSDERAKNNISLSFGAIGVELSYERMFSRHWSVLADVSCTTMIVIDEFTASAKGRWYPFGETFYLDLGLGYSYGKGLAGLTGDFVLTILTFGLYESSEDDVFTSGGFLIQPGLGWKIDIGKPDGFVLPVAMGLDVKLGNEVSDFMPFLRAGLGYSF